MALVSRGAITSCWLTFGFIRACYDVRMEMKKVTTPSLKEVQATTIVVVITVFIFGVYFWLVDFVIGRGIDFLFRSLGHS